MRSYEYVARDFAGVRREGLRQADSSNDVLAWLCEQGLTPISMKEIPLRTRRARRLARRGRVKSADLAALFWQLSTMAEGGIPIATALEAVAEDMDNLQLRGILQHVVEKMERGESFSESISGFPRVFDQMTCAMVFAGESGGQLPRTMQRLAEHFDHRDDLAKKIKHALAYPAFVFLFIIIVVAVITVFIVPRFREIFRQMGGELPTFTQGFLHFYDMIRYNFPYLVGAVLIAVVTLILIYSKTQSGHVFFNRIALGLPLFGRIAGQAFTVVFCRTMSTLLASGVSVLEVLDILARMTDNYIIRDAILVTKKHIVGGSSISLSMAASGFFPNMVVKMVQVGEESGSLPRVLEKTGNYYERRVNFTVATMMDLLEPVMIVVIGAIIIVVLIALYLPIFSMQAH